MRQLATILFVLSLSLSVWGLDTLNTSSQHDEGSQSLWRSFLTPPGSIRVGCYYYWVNERVDPKGVKADLRWMKDNGITLAFLATDIRNRDRWDNPWEGQLFGKNKFQSKLWWKNLRTALRTAGELGIEMGIFNFHAGINATILHVMISQPGDEREPAVRPWFGTFFDRRSQHAADLKPLVSYLRRCNFMLQLGQPCNNATDQRIMDDGTVIRFTDDSLFEVTFADGHQETWNPLTCKKQ